MERPNPRVIVRLLRLMGPYQGRMALATAFVLLSAAFVLVQPKLLAWAIDFGLKPSLNGGLGLDGNLPLLGFAALALLGAAILRGAFSFGQQYMGEWISQRVAYDLRNRIYDQLQRLSYAYHDRQQTGQLMSRATQDVEAVRLFILWGVLRLLYTAVLLGAAAGLMLTANWRLALVTLAFLPPVAWRTIVVTLQLRPLWLEAQDALGRMGTVLQENLSGMRVVKAFGRQEREGKKFAKEATALFDNAYTASRIQAVNGPMMGGIFMVGFVVTIWYGGFEIQQGRLTAGDLAAFTLYLTLLQAPVRMLGWVMTVFARAGSSGERVFEILDAESAVKEKPGALDLRDVRGEVRFEGVSFGYDSISSVLREIDLHARPGAVVALLGPTGSGKSTIVNLIPRFYDVSAGRITIDGVDTRDVTLSSLRRSIGIVQQDVFLFSATLRENIAYGAPGASEEEVVRAAKAAHIHEFVLSLPDGYDTWVGERGVTLSGGQKQRVAIARTLLTDPRILILDDSTSSMDTETEYLIQQALAELMHGRTTFVIAQRLRTVREADQILVLREGRVVERGRHRELLARNRYYRQIYDLELRDQEEALATPTALGELAAASGGAGGM